MKKIPVENVHPDATLMFAENSPKDDYENRSTKSS